MSQNGDLTAIAQIPLLLVILLCLNLKTNSKECVIVIVLKTVLQG